ncbi:bifunctional 2-polyprenyl-6-hydroxyphenol methylase/3-demethylubiquinol 3-O-methyltransferase UbiG [Cellulomonas sp. PhB143]|uniref:class I SAM-dependent methyltransferase n=1 Tax=Cellulomonas sp. PhB143 TaxID=2485186 RepID=UPI000FB0FA87|nr:class I SAM-dependent methyltransferase [Cellulomonas sp. PhB143]ROS72066.1 methyltransferase family protein [Cellulomonas sp. PhB143]
MTAADDVADRAGDLETDPSPAQAHAGGPTSPPARRVHPISLYEEALTGAPVLAVGAAEARPLDVSTWSAPPSAVDEMILARCEGPVLDIGCGPGRLAAALGRRGVPCLGIDVSPRAVHEARSRGAMALRRAVERPLPGEGRWGTALLADGNVGIGGDPAALLARCRELVVPGGLVVVEADPEPDVDEVSPVVLRAADGRESHPMPWARVGVTALARLARGVGLEPEEEWILGGRTIMALRRPR